MVVSRDTKTGETMCGKTTISRRGMTSATMQPSSSGMVGDTVEFVGALRERHVEGVFFLE